MIWCKRLYRTTSFNTVLVLADQPPVNLLVEEATERYKIAKSKNSNWLGGEVGPGQLKEAKRELKIQLYSRWTREVDEMNLKDLRRVVLNGRIAPIVRSHILNFHSSQLLSRHGSFNFYLHHINRNPDDVCPFNDERETPGHILTECSGHHGLRTELRLTAKELEVSNWPFADLETASRIAKFAQLAILARNKQ